MSAAFPNVNLSLSAGTDFFGVLTCLSFSGAQVGIGLASAVMVIRVTPSDPTPLVTVSTTPSGSGVLQFGVTFPSPSGLSVSNAEGLLAIGPTAQSSFVLTEPSATVANLAALAALDTSTFEIGLIAFVSAGDGSYFAWSPSDPSTPNGTTIIAGSGGNWLLAGTLIVNLTAAATAQLNGIEKALVSTFVTWADGTVSNFTSGFAYTSQLGLGIGTAAPAPPPTTVAMHEDTFTPTTGQTVFTASLSPLGVVSMYVNGVLYTLGEDYTVSGQTVTWINPLTIQSAWTVSLVYLAL